jgi:hypothetical protein
MFDAKSALADLSRRCINPLASAFATGAIVERRLHRAVCVDHKSGVKTTAEDIARRLQIDLPPGISIGQMPAWLRARAAEIIHRTFQEPYWQRIPETTRDDIEVTLRNSIDEGLSVREVSRQIMERHGDQYDRWRSVNVARTEMTNALNAGHVEGIRQTAQETGLRIGKEWVSVLGTTTRETHADADGQQTPDAEGNFTLAGYEVPWPGHWSLPASERCHCFPAGTLVRSIGSTQAVMRAWYEGVVYEITTVGGRRLSVTENHPVLTASGWVAAGKLKIGDQLFATTRQVESSVANEQIQDEPTRIEQMFEAARERSVFGSGASGYKLRRCSRRDFYGDGEFSQGYVEIVLIDSDLRADRESAADKVRRDQDFSRVNIYLPELLRHGAAASSFNRLSGQAASVPSGRKDVVSQSGSVVVVEPRPAATLPIGVRADFAAVGSQSFGEPRTTHPVPFGDALKVLACVVVADHVAQIVAVKSACHVYDLQTESGLIEAGTGNGGVIVSNCQCSVISSVVMDEISDEPKPEPTPEPEPTPPPAVEPPPAQEPQPIPAWEPGTIPTSDQLGAMSYEELRRVPVEHVVNLHPELNDVHQRVLKAADKFDRLGGAPPKAKLDKAAEDYNKAHKKVYELEAKWMQANERGDKEKAKALMEKIDAAAAKFEAAKTKYAGMLDKRFKANEFKTPEEARRSFLASVGVPKGERLKIYGVKAPMHPPEYRVNLEDGGSVVVQFQDQNMLRTSTGDWDRNSHVGRRIEEAKNFVEPLIAKRGVFAESERIANEVANVRFHLGEEGVRAHAKAKGHDVTKSDAPNYRGVFISPSDDVGTVVHELGHVIEGARGDGMTKRAEEFRQYRTAKTPDVPMRKYSPFYSEWEIGNEDRFHGVFDSDAKPGKVYDEKDNVARRAAYTGKGYGMYGTELTSMGLEAMYRDPYRLAKNDPELFKFVIGVLRGIVE